MAAKFYQYAYLVNRCDAFEYEPTENGVKILNYDYVKSFFADEKLLFENVSALKK